MVDEKATGVCDSFLFCFYRSVFFSFFNSETKTNSNAKTKIGVRLSLKDVDSLSSDTTGVSPVMHVPSIAARDYLEASSYTGNFNHFRQTQK